MQFQLTHPWGCDVLSKLLRKNESNFNSHTREGVTAIRCILIHNLRFQLTHPWGCDNPVKLIFWDFPKFQLTHPWGCDLIPLITKPFFSFQLTHPWGCDTSCRYVIHIIHISTHTPVRVWQSRLLSANAFGYFNSHTREGVTPLLLCTLHTDSISTHTPVRVWLWKRISRSQALRFQLTHPWGCDPHREDCNMRRYDFNSHTREGVTGKLRQ